MHGDQNAYQTDGFKLGFIKCTDHRIAFKSQPHSLYHIHCKHLLMLGVSMCHVGDLPFIVYFSFCTIMDSLQYLDIMKSLFIYARLMLCADHISDTANEIDHK